MKRGLLTLLFLVCLSCCLFFIVACNNENGNIENLASIESVEGGKISGNEIFMLVDSNTEDVPLSNKIKCDEGSTWQLYYDKLGRNEITTKVATGISGSLADGDNLFYILVTSEDQGKTNFYNLTIHRSYLANIDYYDGDTMLSREQVYTGTNYQINFLPTLAGYTFSNWVDSSNNAITQIDVWGNTNLYAVKTPNIYTVQLDSDGGELTEIDGTQVEVTYGESFYLPRPFKKGYSFIGWYNDSVRVTGSSGYSSAAWSYPENITLTAKWRAGAFRVSIEQNIIEAGSVLGDGIYDYDSMVTVTATSNEGYNFIGWYDETENLLNESSSYTFKMGEDISLIAKWDFYTLSTQINNNLAGVITEYDNEKISVGDKVTIQATSNNGYTWLGWYSNDELITTDFVFTFEMEKENRVFVAKWIECPITVEANNSDVGSVSMSETTVIGQEITIVATTDRLGYDFVGWYNGDKKITDKPEYSFILTDVEQTFIAEWKVKPELENFIFSSSSDSLSINGVKDKTVTEIIVPDYVTYIYQAFGGCYNLKKLTMPFINNTLGYYFGADSYLQNDDYVPQSLEIVTITNAGDLKSCVFYNCNKLKQITILGTTNNLGNRAFAWCTQLETVNLPNTVRTMGYEVFSQCNSLKNINLPNGLLQIGKGCFYECYSLTELVIPNTVVTIGDHAFYNCGGLKNIVIPFSVRSMGSEVFYSCYMIEIFCEAPYQPSTWAEDWNVDWDSTHNVTWGYEKPNI